MRIRWTLLLTLCVFGVSVAAADESSARTTPFADVPKTHWAYDAVESLRKQDILRGYPPEVPKVKPAAKKPKPQAHGKRRSA